jgi:hypothetical protein
MYTRCLFNFYFQQAHLYCRKNVAVRVLSLATGCFAEPETIRAVNWSRQLTDWEFIDTHRLHRTTYL